MGGRDRRPPPPGPEAGHYEVASDRGADQPCAAALYTLIETARLNDVDPRAWLADVRINDHPAKAIDDLLPWNWKAGNQADIAA